MANLYRNLITGSVTGLVVREQFQVGSAEYFLKIAKDGVEYADIFSMPAAADVTLLNTALAEGKYYTVDIAPGATTNDQPVASNTVLH